MTAPASLEGWTFGGGDTPAMPWGTDGDAVAQVIATADGYHLMLVRADAGYRGTPHDHAHAELTYVLEGTVVTNGHELHAGEGAAAPAGSHHESFRAVTDAVYLSVFKL